MLAVITSRWFFDEVVCHSPACDAATYRPVQIAVKETSTMAWISLPDHPYPPAPALLTTPPAEYFPDSVSHRFSASGSVPGFMAGAPLGEVPVPRQLPLAIRDFTGRAEHLAALDALLPTNDTGHGDPTGPRPAGAVVISAIGGTAGVGKTTLAVHWAHRVQNRFPDGTLYVNLRGYGPEQPAASSEVLGSFLAALGCPPQRVPIELDAQSALYRSLLAGRRVLIVLDNANAAEQVRPLLPGSPGSLVLITSRASLTGLVISDAATRLTLDLLTHTEAMDLMRGILGADRVAAEPQAVTELIRMCALLPLALRIAAARAASRPHQSIADMVGDMIADRTRLDALSALGDDRTSVRAVFVWSYHRLDTAQARLFRRLGLHPGPEISLHAAAAVADLDLPDTRRLLDTLTDAHLLHAVARDRYRLHDLLRAYAADRAEHDDPSHERDRARRTLLEWYAHHCAATWRVLYPTFYDWHPLGTFDAHTRNPITFAGRSDALTWLRIEHANLIAAAHQAADHNLPQLAIIIAHHGAGPGLGLRGAWNELVELVEFELDVARRSNDRHWEWHALGNLCEAHQSARRWAEAFSTGQDLLALARALGDPSLTAIALAVLGSCCHGQRRYAEAINYRQQALPLSPGAQRGRLEGSIEIGLSADHNGLGHYEQALSHAERGLAIMRQAGRWDDEVRALWRIAQARQGLDRHTEAIAPCEQALNRAEDLIYPLLTAAILDTLGRSLQHTGAIDRALTCWREALDTFDKFADPRAADLRARLHALEETPPRHAVYRRASDK